MCWQTNILLIYWYFPTEPSLGLQRIARKEKVPSDYLLSGWNTLLKSETMAGMFRADRKMTLTQITTRCNQGMKKSIFECTACKTLKHMG